ncbi:MAG: type II TA system antitoxin MqsA family protein [Chlamydiota bacterium]
MRCFKCNNPQLEKRRRRFYPEIKGVKVEVIVEANVCQKCGASVMDPSMMDALRRSAADKYRSDRGLLTSEQIRTYRESLGMSQSAFARYLHVGEASIKRWETYYIQDSGQDEHIRLKCDAACAEYNALAVYWKTDSPNIYSGKKRFDLQMFNNVALYLIAKTNETIIYLNKLHFYIDFLHYRRCGKSLTGARYVPLKHGPCPDQYRELYRSLEREGAIVKKGNGFEPKTAPDNDRFDDRELETLETVMKIYARKGMKFLYNLSHQERGFIETEECAFISYAFASDLQLVDSVD